MTPSPPTMPIVFAEQALGRRGMIVMTWLSIAIGVAASVLFIGGALGEQRPGIELRPFFVAVPVLWWLIVAGIFLARPRRSLTTPSDESIARTPDGAGVLIRGNVRQPIISLALAIGILGFLAVVAWTFRGGWAIFSGILALLLLYAALSAIMSIRRPRVLQLTPSGVRSVSFARDAGVDWDDIDDITYAQGMAAMMTLRLIPGADAPSPRTFWSNPLAGKRRGVDIELSTYGIDGTLLLLALAYYRESPQARGELVGTGLPPRRLFDEDYAVSTTPVAISAPILLRFRPAPARSRF